MGRMGAAISPGRVFPPKKNRVTLFSGEKAGDRPRGTPLFPQKKFFSRVLKGPPYFSAGVAKNLGGDLFPPHKKYGGAFLGAAKKTPG